jgi:hypothetical protein
MGVIEDVMYEAYDLNINKEVMKEVSNLRNTPKYRYLPLSNIYEDAFNNVVNRNNEKKKTM